MPNGGASALPVVPVGPTTCAAVYELRAVIRTKQLERERERGGRGERKREREGYMTGAGAMTHCCRDRQRGIG